MYTKYEHEGTVFFSNPVWFLKRKNLPMNAPKESVYLSEWGWMMAVGHSLTTMALIGLLA